MRLFLKAVLLIAVSATAVSAQKQCKKGIPCGGTCISATKTCRVGSSSGSSSAGGLQKPTDSLSDVLKARIDSAIREHRESAGPSPSTPSSAPARVVPWDEASQLSGSMQPWVGHRVKFVNAVELPAAATSARVALVYADRFVARSGTTSIVVPFNALQSIYAEMPPSEETAVVTVVFRRQ